MKCVTGSTWWSYWSKHTYAPAASLRMRRGMRPRVPSIVSRQFMKNGRLFTLQLTDQYRKASMSTEAYSVRSPPPLSSEQRTT